MLAQLIALSLAASERMPPSPQEGPPAALTNSAASVDKTTQTEDVQFRDELNDRMTVPVLLSGSGPYRFMVDTGANRTAISSQLAAQLNLRSGNDARLHSVAGVSIAHTAIIPALQLTRKPVKSIEAPLLASANMGADGVLGTDSLGSQRIVFDFDAKTMSIVPSYLADRHDEPGTIVVEARRRNGRLIVTDATADGTDLTVVLDTGAELTIGNEALRRALAKGGLQDGLERVELLSVTGERIVGDYMFLRDLAIGGVTLHNLAIVFAPAHTFEQLNLAKKPAILLGMNAMRAFKKVSIDFASRTLRVILPESSRLDVRVARAAQPRSVGR
jgi:predicted aspartyl protease